MLYGLPMSEIFQLSDEAVDLLAADNPIEATFAGIAGHDNAWPDWSPTGTQARCDLWRSLKARAEACPADTNPDRLAQRVLVGEADAALRRAEQFHHHYDLNNIASPTQELREAFDMQAAKTEDDWEAIIERLNTIGEPLDGYRETLEEARAQGHIVARRQVQAVIDQLEITAGNQSGFHELRSRLADAELATTGLPDRLEAAIAAAKSASGHFGDYLTNTYLPGAAIEDPVGTERYVAAAQNFLGESLEPADAYRWGWDEVERLTARAVELCAVIAPGSSLADVLTLLNTDPSYGVATADEFVAVMAERQHLALEQLSGTHFDVPDQIREIDVKMAPPGGAAGAYYTPPAEDFSRPGTVWYSAVGRDSFPIFGEITTAYHEGFPGHHLQVGTQMVLADELSRFHRLLVWYPGSGEGWALYAEHLMGELGYFERPEYELGLVLAQLFRSCRVAIDIGSHCGYPIPGDVSFHPGASWSFELAVQLLLERSAEPEAAVRSEVTRYYGWPGQAISYKIGERAILDLKDQMLQRPEVDLKSFHSKLLSVGSLGLDLTRELLA